MLAVVNLMVSADVTSDENVAKGKREAPMAEPSTDYLPPRLEAPYATYQPIVVGGSAPHSSFYQSPTPSSAPAYEYNRFTGVQPLPAVDSNDLGNGYHPGPPYNHNHNQNNNNGYQGSGYVNSNNVRGGTSSYGGFAKYGPNSQANFASNYALSNGFGQSLSLYSSNGYENNAPNFDQYSTIKENAFGNTGPSFENSFYGNPSLNAENKYPSSAALVANEPGYANGVKGLRHYAQSAPVSSLNAQTLKNSRPIALQPAHMVRKPSPFLSEQRNPNFRPSFLLGSSVVSSTPDYNPPSLTSLGTANQYLPPSQNNIPEAYAAPQSLGNLPLQQEYLQPYNGIPNFANSYQANGGFSQPQQQQSQLPTTSYGLPETIIYTKSSLYGERYGQTQ